MIIVVPKSFSNILKPIVLSSCMYSFEKLNMYILAKCILSGTLNFLNYVNEYIRAVNPRIVITFVDNSLPFYMLKRNHPDIKFVFVQNGIRSIGCDVFQFLIIMNTNIPYSVDYMLTFGQSIGTEYQKYINGTVIPIGSMRCNMTQKVAKKPSNRIGFISQFSEFRTIPQYQFKNKTLSFQQFYTAETVILRFLSKYVRELGLRLVVVGRNQEYKSEQEYFSKIILDDFYFYHRERPLGSYKMLDSCLVIVTTDSTIGYESLAKGYKSAILSIRSYFIEDESFKFGWPAQFPDKGPFWTNIPDENHFREILDYLFRVDQEEWVKVVKHYTKNLIEYDYGNSRFLNLMRELDVPVRNPLSL